MTNDDKDLNPMIEKTECQECKALVSMNEYHTFSHCLIAKAYPDFWRSIVKDLTSKTTPKQPSEPLKELDKEELWKENYKAVWDALDLVWEAINEISPMPSQESLLPPEPGRYAEEMVKAVAKFGQPSEKKALSVSELKMILQKLAQMDCGDNSCLFGGRGKGGMRTNGGCRCYGEVAQAIHSALPARKEVRWPEFPDKGHKSICHCGYCQKKNIRKEIIDACKAAVEETKRGKAECTCEDKQKNIDTGSLICRCFCPRCKNEVKIRSVKDMNSVILKAPEGQEKTIFDVLNTHGLPIEFCRHLAREILITL